MREARADVNRILAMKYMDGLELSGNERRLLEDTFTCLTRLLAEYREMDDGPE